MISGYRGLAESLIEACLEKQHQVSILVRDAKALGTLQEKYPSSLLCVGEIQNRQDAQSWLQQTMNHWGRIDHLINNAAITGPCGKLHELKFDEFEETLKINFLAPVFLIQLALPHFLNQGRGTVINLSGGGATAPRPNFGAYGSSKCALVRITESLALEYPHLSFYSISPGAMRTPMMEGISKISSEKIGKEQEEAKRRMEQGGDDPRQAAHLITWLCEHRPQPLNGKLISAKWDDYVNPSPKLSHLPFWTLRRVDEVLMKQWTEETQRDQ
jgi:NAD(P)-dependent dehydrogenase (short-subunit alcohol dehydrogenase family)